MLRIVAVLVVSCLPAMAQSAFGTKIASSKIGTDCVGPLTASASKIQTCLVASTATRIWCPNGDVMERRQPDVGAVLRSLCGINQSIRD